MPVATAVILTLNRDGVYYFYFLAIFRSGPRMFHVQPLASRALQEFKKKKVSHGRH